MTLEENPATHAASLYAQSTVWRQKADEHTPVLQHVSALPSSLCELRADSSLLLGIGAVPVADGSTLGTRALGKGEKIILDFGEHHVGQFILDMDVETPYCDSPTRIRIMPAELPYELEYKSADFHGTLSKSWMPEEFFTFDELPLQVRLPRTYAARYLLLEVVAAPQKVIFRHVEFDTVSAENWLPTPPQGLDKLDQAIYTVSCRTLRDCMQTVLLDGPKRDRRLWLGDLYLEALANDATFKNKEVIARCIYLLAATVNEQGTIAACAFENPKIAAYCYIPDYTLLFAPLLLDYARLSGDTTVAAELYDLAVQQYRNFRKHLGGDALLHKTDGLWFFVDHCPDLSKDTAEYCIYTFGMQKLAELATLLGKTADAAEFTEEASGWRSIMRENCFDARRCILLSGAERQISDASQLWGVLAEVLTAEEGKKALAFAETAEDAFHIRTPYLKHYQLWAYAKCGDWDGVKRHIRRYWGKMLELGADTFWEAFDQGTGKIDIYEDPMLNSACHAWSCTPCVFLSDNFKL